MKGKRILGLLLAGLLLGSTARAADITVTVEGSSVPAFVEEGVTYVQLTPFLEHLGGWETRWDHDAYTASAETDLFTLDVPVRRDYVLANGYLYGVSSGNLLHKERTYVPLRSVANLLGAEVEFVDWDNSVTVCDGVEQSWTEEDLHWLSRIISAESRGESLAGQIAVGDRKSVV